MNKKDLKTLCFSDNDTVYMDNEVKYLMSTALAACDLLLEFTSPTLDQSPLSCDQIEVVAKINDVTRIYVNAMELLQSKLIKSIKPYVRVMVY